MLSPTSLSTQGANRSSPITSQTSRSISGSNQDKNHGQSAYFPQASSGSINTKMASTDCIQVPEQLKKLDLLANELTTLANNSPDNQGQTSMQKVAEQVKNCIDNFSSIYNALPNTNRIPNSKAALKSLFEITDRLLFIILHIYTRDDLTKEYYDSLTNSLDKLSGMLNHISEKTHADNTTWGTYDPSIIFFNSAYQLNQCYSEHEELFVDIRQILPILKENTSGDELENYYVDIEYINRLNFYSNYELSRDSEDNRTYAEFMINNVFDTIRTNKLMMSELNTCYTSKLKHQCLLKLASSTLNYYHTNINTNQETYETMNSFIKNIISLLNILDENVCNILEIEHPRLEENITYTQKNLDKFLQAISENTERFITEAKKGNMTTRIRSQVFDNVKVANNARLNMKEKCDQLEKIIAQKIYEPTLIKTVDNSIDEFVTNYDMCTTSSSSPKSAHKIVSSNDLDTKYLLQITGSLLFIIVDINYLNLKPEDHNQLTNVMSTLQVRLQEIEPKLDPDVKLSALDLRFSQAVAQLITCFKNKKFENIVNDPDPFITTYTKLLCIQELNITILKNPIDINNLKSKNSNYLTSMDNIIKYLLQNQDLKNLFTKLNYSDPISVTIHNKLLQLVSVIVTRWDDNNNQSNPSNKSKSLQEDTITIINTLNHNLSKILNENSYAFNKYEIYTQDEIKTIFNIIKEKSERVLNPTMSDPTDSINQVGKDINTYVFSKENTYVKNLEILLSFLIGQTAIERIIIQILNINKLVETGIIVDGDLACAFLATKPDRDGYQYRRVALCLSLMFLEKIEPTANKYSDLIPLYDNTKNIKLMKTITITESRGNENQFTITIPQKRLLGKKIPKHNSFTIGREKSTNHAAITPSSNTAGNRRTITTTLTTLQVTELEENDLYDGDL
ncbi:MAG: hypothetical protein QG673_2145 [Pseudomonadota bacterium]|nr:hypothetical protein [Pseudomonadota bacterium]